jgi:hypothetical protein
MRTMKRKLFVIALLVVPALLMAREPIMLGDVEATVIGLERSEGPDTCASSAAFEPTSYYWDYMQEFEFTLAECEYTDPMWVKAIVVAWYNGDTMGLDHEKDIQLWLTPPGACPDCYDPNAMGFNATTTTIPAGYYAWIQYDVYELGIPFEYKMWFGHFEFDLAWPTSMLNVNIYDLEQNYDDVFLNVWTLSCDVADCYGDYTYLQFLVLDTLPPVSVQENTPVGSHSLDLDVTAEGQIRFSMPVAADADIRVFDAKGSLIEEIRGTYTAGTHTVQWNNAVNGVYFVTLKSGDLMATKKFALMK